MISCNMISCPPKKFQKIYIYKSVYIIHTTSFGSAGLIWKIADIWVKVNDGGWDRNDVHVYICLFLNLICILRHLRQRQQLLVRRSLPPPKPKPPMDPAKLAKLQAAAAANRIGELLMRSGSSNLLFISFFLRWKGNCASKNRTEN
jgi:hypothetical protein